MNRRFVFALAVVLLSITSARTIRAQDSPPRLRLISVTGTAEVSVPPDEVILSLGVESREKELANAKAQNDARGKKVIALAHAAGVEPKDIQTSAVTMGPNYSEEKVPRLLGYEVSQSITITLRDLSKYEDLMTKLLEAGINRVDGISFQIAEPRKHRNDARSQAIRAAREKAIAMAAALGQTIGKPWDISEESEGSPYQRGIANVNLVTTRILADVVQPTVAPGQVTIRASVRVSFQLE